MQTGSPHRAGPARPRRIHYFSFYLTPDQATSRGSNVASFGKIEYTKQVLASLTGDVRLVSTSIALRPGYLPRELRRVSAEETHEFLPSVRLPGRVLFPVSAAHMWWQIVWYLLTKVRRGDVVLAYHSPVYFRSVALAHRLRRFPLVLEVNEIYSAIWDKYRRRRRGEERLIRAADGYLFMSTSVAEQYADGKPHAICHGTYLVHPRPDDRDSGIVTRAVYAGIVDFRNGALLAARSAEFLDPSFEIHLLAFGPFREMDELKATVKDVNERTGRKAVTLHGQLRGPALTAFLHSCHIGLSTHRYLPHEAEAAKSCFPSKVSLYLSHDLQVVSGDIPVLRDSPLAESVSFYDADRPDAIADAIVRARDRLNDNVEATAPTRLLATLDGRFRDQVAMLLDDITRPMGTDARKTRLTKAWDHRGG